MTIPAALYYTTPSAIDLQITQGDDWFERFDITDINGAAVDITGITAATLLIKDAFGGTLLATATCAIASAVNGQISATLAKAVTTALTIPGAANNIRLGLIGYYDLQLTDGSLYVTVCGGNVNLWREISV